MFWTKLVPQGVALGPREPIEQKKINFEKFRVTTFMHCTAVPLHKKLYQQFQGSRILTVIKVNNFSVR